MSAVFTATAAGSVTSSKNCLIQVAGGNAAGKANFKILRVWIKAYGLTSAQSQEVEFWEVPIADIGTSMTANTPIANDTVSAPSIQSTITTWATGQTDPTGETVIWNDGYDQRSGAGFLYIPTPEERFLIANNLAFCVVFPSGIAATTTLAYGITIEEV